MVFFLSAFWWIRVRGLEVSWWKELAVEESGFCSGGRGMLSKSLTHFFVNGRGCFPSLLFGLRLNYGRGNGSNCDFPPKDLCQPPLYSVPLTPQQATVNPQLRWRLLDTHRKSRSVSCRVTAPFSCVLVHRRVFLCPPRACFPSLVEVL